MKKLILTFVALVVAFLPSHAIVKEKNMDLTVKRLYEDLQVYQENLEYNMSQFESQRNDHWAHLMKCMHQCQENTIVLYTQQEDHLFALSQACDNLETLMDEFRKDTHPFEKWKASFESEIERYKRLQELLERIRTSSLTTKGEEARQGCIAICKEIGDRLAELQEEIVVNGEQYDKVNDRLEEMASYNTSRFEEIRGRVFLSGGESYFSILASFGSHWRTFVRDLKPTALKASSKAAVREKKVVFWSGLGCFAVALIVFLVINFLVFPAKWRTQTMLSRRKYIAISGALGTFTLLMYLVSNSFMSKYFILPSVNLFLEFTLILFIIMVSVTLRSDRQHVSASLSKYIPLVLMSFIVIVERIALVSNSVVDFTLPIVLLVSALWQLLHLLKHGEWKDMTVGALFWITFIVTSICCVMSWLGYNFLALLLIFYWILQLTCFQGVLCMKFLLKQGEKERKAAHVDKVAWFDMTMDKLVLPIFTILTLVISVKWSASIFSMNSWVTGLIHKNLIGDDIVGVAVSFNSILLLIAAAFAVNWLIHVIQAALRTIYKDEYTKGPIPLYMTLASIFIWFLYIVIAIKLLNIDSKGLIAAIGGMGVGVGFAMKDTIEDLFCGISLLMGRVHLNDVVECDGIRGKITDIGIRSTTLETLDGSVISFLNNQLFAKNFKNLTKNHKYELAIIDVGVAYGTDVDKAKDVILTAIGGMSCFRKGHAPVVHLSSFGDSSVDLQIKGWLPVTEKVQLMSDIREAVYRAFAENSIEIPFPQQDVHIIDVPKTITPTI